VTSSIIVIDVGGRCKPPIVLKIPETLDLA